MSRSTSSSKPLAQPPSTGRANNDTRISKRKLSASSSNSGSFMDPDVIEIPPPVPRSFKSKQKQVVIHQVIDVDSDEDLTDIMILDERVGVRDKGKAVKSSSAAYRTIQCEDLVTRSLGSVKKVKPSKNSTQGSQNIFNLDHDLAYDDEYFEFAMIQAHFDSVDIPAGVEASVPWFSGFSNSKKKNSHGNISSAVGANDQFLPSWLSEPAHINKKVASISNSSFQTPGDFLIHSSGGAGLSSPFLFPQGSQSKKSATSEHILNRQNLSFEYFSQSPQTGALTNGSNGSHSDAMMHPDVVPPADWGNHHYYPIQAQTGASSLLQSNFFTPVDVLNPKGVVEPSMSWSASPLPMKVKYSVNKQYSYPSFPDPVAGAHITPQEVADLKNQRNVNADVILSKLQLFKKFDTVEDFSDHHYALKGASTKQPPKSWSKKIQEDWKILEKDLPDTIFVRVSESRMDLLRAVIIGAEGTPYHDGLFFFDVFFPASYPKAPPHVHYHSGGLRLNPNLYNCGKVCLSLLNTWSGNKNEKWIPSMSTMLQVLVSIQALILNQKPYFNEPGRELLSRMPQGESLSRQYNEDTFILSLRTMIYSMKRPPKHFEDFVVGHFYRHAHDILVACKAYMDGAQVGCLAKGGVQDVDEGDKSCSQKFKDSVAGCVNLLVKEFTLIGVDCEKFLTAPKCQN